MDAVLRAGDKAAFLGGGTGEKISLSNLELSLRTFTIV
jgi:hypothetical protein